MSKIDVTKCENYKLGFSGYICADPNLRNDCSLNNNCKFKQLHRQKQAIENISKGKIGNCCCAEEYAIKIIQKCEEVNKQERIENG